MNLTKVNRAGKHFVRSLTKILGGLCCIAVATVLAGCEPVVVEVPGKPVIVEVPAEPVIIEVPAEPVVVEVPVQGPGCRLPEYQRARAFLVEAWAVPDSQFNVGEPLSAQVRVSTPAYVNMYHISTSCKVTRLLHNVQVEPAQIADFPRQNSRMIIVKPPTGDEAFYVIATREPMAFIADTDILQGGDGLASIDLSADQFYQRLDQVLGRINPDDLSVTTLRTSIVGN